MLRHRLPSVLLLGAVLLVPGCGRKPAGNRVAKAQDYKPPADGHLSAGQVRMYLDVRRREQKIREAAFKNQSLPDVATADLRAAQELGFNPREYQWVRDRVMEAQMLQATQALHQQVAVGREALLRSLERQKKTAGAAGQAEIDRHIQDLRGSAEGVVERDPAKAFNAQLLARTEDLRKGPPDGH
jgi:uncharacterized protein YicC (UPF0701 family)